MHPLRLFIVDDDPDMLRLMTQLAERAVAGRYTVQSFADSELARNRISETGVDILVTDLEMPAPSGLQLLRCAKQRNAWTQTLMITGHSSQEALLEAMECGASDYLLKPIDANEFIELLQQTMSRQQRWRESLAKTWKRQHQPESGVQRLEA